MTKKKYSVKYCAGRARGCQRTRKSEHVMCPDCWSRVPPEIQREVHDTRPATPTGSTNGPDPHHAAAIMKAIRSLPRRKLIITSDG